MPPWEAARCGTNAHTSSRNPIHRDAVSTTFSFSLEQQREETRHMDSWGVCVCVYRYLSPLSLHFVSSHFLMRKIKEPLLDCQLYVFGRSQVLAGCTPTPPDRVNRFWTHQVSLCPGASAAIYCTSKSFRRPLRQLCNTVSAGHGL